MGPSPGVGGGAAEVVDGGEGVGGEDAQMDAPAQAPQVAEPRASRGGGGIRAHSLNVSISPGVGDDDGGFRFPFAFPRGFLLVWFWKDTLSPSLSLSLVSC